MDESESDGRSVTDPDGGRDHADWAREVMAGYDDVADAYDEARSPAEEVPFVESLVADLSPGARVLDAGCGGGRAVLETLDGEYETVGLDVSETQLALASERAPAATLVRGDVARLPFADDAFDALASLHTVIHVPREHHGAVFAEYARVCRPGAPVLVTVGTGAWEGETDDWLDSGARMRWSFHGADRMRTLVHDAGFTIVEEATVGDELGGGEWLCLRGHRDA